MMMPAKISLFVFSTLMASHRVAGLSCLFPQSTSALSSRGLATGRLAIPRQAFATSFTQRKSTASILPHRHWGSTSQLIRLFSTKEANMESTDKSSATTSAPKPPVAFRDEKSFFLAGALPNEPTEPTTNGNETNGNSNKPKSPPLRQSPSSPNPLLSPAVKVPNPYGWLRDDFRTDEKVLQHLRDENTYSKEVTSHLETLREELYEEMRVGMVETDHSTPALKKSRNGDNDGYWYYTRWEAGVSYPWYCRAPRKLVEGEDNLFHPPVNPDWNAEKNSDAASSKKIDGEADKVTTISPSNPLLPGEQIYLNLPTLSETKKNEQNVTYMSVGAIAISPNQEYMAYSVDEKGGETCQLYVRKIDSEEEWVLYDNSKEKSVDSGASGEESAPPKKKLLECDGSVVWNDDNTAIYYVTMDDAHRPYRVYRRNVFDKNGNFISHESNDDEDELLLEEKDELYNVRISKTFDGKYFLVRSSSKESSEVHYLDLKSEDADTSKLKCIATRRPKVLYRVTHCQGYWLISTNVGGTPNLRLMTSKVGDEGEGNGENWADLMMGGWAQPLSIPVFDGSHQRSLDGITVFMPSEEDIGRNSNSGDLAALPLAYGVVTGREEGLPRIWVIEFNKEDGSPDTLAATKITRLEFDETAFDVGIGPNRDNTLPYVVVSYDSLITPPSNIAIPLNNPEDLAARRVLKQKDVPGYKKENYACERTTVKSRDGKTDIPVSLVYHKDILEERSSGNSIPTHLYGYGSYGASMEASFRSTRLSLLKRGVVYVIAHIRGGGEMGRPWYEEPNGAKYLCKRNTFDDFVDVARWLTKKEMGRDEAFSVGMGITNPSKLSCEGRSAGGLLIGASLNQDPELFRAAILGVPFVDVVNTMTDSTIPLTVAEWEEWGNPNEEKFFEYMMSYCPMNNVQKAKYPSCLLTGGLHDPRVQFWEPAKYAQELRHKMSDDSGLVLLKMDMEAGHFSASDRYKYLKELAFDYAFLLDQLGLVD